MDRAAVLCAGIGWILLIPGTAAAQQLVPCAEARMPAAVPVSLRADRVVPVSEADLAGNRGGETKVIGNQTLTSVTKGNVLNGNYSAGSVTLSDKALSNFNGISNLVINTGAQVSLQSGMNLTINVAP